MVAQDQAASKKGKRLKLASRSIGASERLAQLRAEAGVAAAVAAAKKEKVDGTNGTGVRADPTLDATQNGIPANAPEAAAGAPSATADAPAGDEEAAEEDMAPEERASMLRGLWILIASLAGEFLLDAFSGGTCQYFALMAAPVWFGFRWLKAKLLHEEFVGPTPPPPPAAPDWASATAERIFDFAEERPVIYLGLNFGIAFAIAIFFLFLKDMTDWWEARQAAARAEAQSKKKGSGAGKATDYKPLADEDDLETGKNKELDPAQLAKELRRVTDRTEELEIKVKVFKKATSDAANEVRNKLKALTARRDELRAIVLGSSQPTKPSAESAAAKGPQKSEGCLQSFLKSSFMQAVTRAANGILAVSLYFADIISDIQVLQLLWSTGNYTWGVMSVFLLLLQFVVVYARVLPYLSSTFGSDSAVYWGFIAFGFPFGLLLLDCLMFLEPFGLLSVLPFPPWLRQFIPAYKSTRIIFEVLIESLPQCMLQAYIYVVVIHNVNDGVATDSQLALVDAVSLLPKSVLISVLATLKTWIELVFGARAAGLTVFAKAIQLWNVGAGLPLDALKKGAISEWTCSYSLDETETLPLLDALSRNSSLVYLDLATSGLIWSGPEANGSALIEKMSQSAATLSSLQRLIISRRTNFEIPVTRLRASHESALKAMHEFSFFGADGPRRPEIILMGDLMRKNAEVGVVNKLEEAQREVVAKLLADAKKGKVTKDGWAEHLIYVLVDGVTRRGHMLNLIAAEALRDVGFTVIELMAADYEIFELRIGGFTASEMKVSGRKAPELKAGGYNAGQMKRGGYTVSQLKAAEYTPAELKAGGFVAKQLKAVGFEAIELKEEGFTCTELRQGTFTAKDLQPLEYKVEELRVAGFSASELKAIGSQLTELQAGGYSASELRAASYSTVEMKAVGFTAVDLKGAGYSAIEMRSAGYNATVMKDAGFSAKKLNNAGYSASELLGVKWSVEVLKGAGYTSAELKEAGCSAIELKAVAFQLGELRTAGFTARELQDAGFGAEELRAAGTSLAELTGAGASVVDLKNAGISAIGLKAEGISLEEMKEVGYTVKELKTAGYTTTQLHGAKFEAHELTSGGFSAKELRDGGYQSAAELRSAGCTVRELKEGGFPAKELKKGGYTAEDLLAGGFLVKDLKDGGFTPAELKAADVAAYALRKAGYPVRALLKEFNAGELKEVGYSAKELHAGGQGFTAADLKAVGFTAKHLFQAGKSAKDLSAAGFTLIELKNADVKAKDLRSVGFTASQLEQYGFGASELRIGGYTAKEVSLALVNQLAP